MNKSELFQLKDEKIITGVDIYYFINFKKDTSNFFKIKIMFEGFYKEYKCNLPFVVDRKLNPKSPGLVPTEALHDLFFLMKVPKQYKRLGFKKYENTKQKSGFHRKNNAR